MKLAEDQCLVCFCQITKNQLENEQSLCLGPMVYSAFFCDENKLDVLTELGCAGNKRTKMNLWDMWLFFFISSFNWLDSKQLTEERRSEIFGEYEKHKDYLGFNLKVLSPHMISTCMLRRYEHSICHRNIFSLFSFSRDKYNLNDMSHGK